MNNNHPFKSSQNRFLLGWFVLVSALAHWVFLESGDNKHTPDVHISLSSPLTVTVVSSRSVNEHPAPAVPQLVEPESKPVNRSVSVEAEKPRSRVSANTAPVKAAKTDPETEYSQTRTSDISKTDSTKPLSDQRTFPPTNNALTSEAQLNHLQQQLKNAIRAHFTYPRIARRMGWQGLVGISLHIDDDGSLHKVQIARSSGHKVLDENARKTIEDIGRIQVASRYSMQATDTEIDVLYKLTD